MTLFFFFLTLMMRLGGSWDGWSAILIDLSTLMFVTVNAGITLLSLRISIESLKGLLLCCSMDCFSKSFLNCLVFDLLRPLLTEVLRNLGDLFVDFERERGADMILTYAKFFGPFDFDRECFRRFGMSTSID